MCTHQVMNVPSSGGEAALARESAPPQAPTVAGLNPVTCLPGAPAPAATAPAQAELPGPSPSQLTLSQCSLGQYLLSQPALGSQAAPLGSQPVGTAPYTPAFLQVMGPHAAFAFLMLHAQAVSVKPSRRGAARRAWWAGGLQTPRRARLYWLLCCMHSNTTHGTHSCVLPLSHGSVHAEQCVPKQARGTAGAAPAAEGAALPAAAPAPDAEAWGRDAEAVTHGAPAPGGHAGQAHEVTKPQVRALRAENLRLGR